MNNQLAIPLGVGQGELAGFRKATAMGVRNGTRIIYLKGERDLKFIKHIKRGICIMLAVIILACSPISCYMDTQRIVTVEATGLEIGGLGLLYTFAQLLGYDIGTVNAGSLRDAFISFVNKLDTIQSDTKKKIVTLVSTQVFGNDVEMGEIGSALFVVLYNFLESGTYEDIGNYNASASASAKQNYAEISFSYSASSPSGYYYNRMPSTARTAIWGQEIDSLQQHYTFFQGVDTSYYFSIYSEREDCYYMNVGGYSASDFTDGGWKEFVMFSDGLYLITFSSNGSIATYDTVDMTKYIYNSAYCTFDEVYDDTISSNSTTMQYYLYDESRGTPFQISTNFCTLKPLSVTKDVFTRSQIPKTYTGLKGLQDSSYASPCTDSLSIVKHGITDSDRIDAISNLETIPASKIASVADSYENALADVYVWSIADTYPAGDKDDTEDKIIADVYPAVDDIKESAKDNTGTKDDTNIDAGTKDDTATGDKTDADTDADTSSFWATLWGWLSKIYEMLKNFLVITDIYLSTKSIEATLSATVINGALQNVGKYDIDIWDTTKDIFGKLVSIDDLSATFNPDKLIANSDEVVYGLGDMSKTITSVREGIDGLVTELSHIGEYDIDIWNVLSSIDKILTNGAIASLGEYLGFLCEELLSSRLGIDSIADIFTDFPATIAKILSAILSLPLSIAQAIIDLLADLLKALFVPDTVALEAELTGFTGKFPWISNLFDWVKYLITLMVTSEPPKLYIHFENSETAKYQTLGTLVIFDASWYTPYKPYGDALLSAFLWALFLWRLFKQMPSIISGAGMVTEQSIKFEDKMNKGD